MNTNTFSVVLENLGNSLSSFSCCSTAFNVGISFLWKNACTFICIAVLAKSSNWFHIVFGRTFFRFGDKTEPNLRCSFTVLNTVFKPIPNCSDTSCTILVLVGVTSEGDLFAIALYAFTISFLRSLPTNLPHRFLTTGLIVVGSWRSTVRRGVPSVGVLQPLLPAYKISK